MAQFTHSVRVLSLPGGSTLHWDAGEVCCTWHNLLNVIQIFGEDHAELLPN